MLKIVIAITHY